MLRRGPGTPSCRLTCALAPKVVHGSQSRCAYTAGRDLEVRLAYKQTPPVGLRHRERRLNHGWSVCTSTWACMLQVRQWAEHADEAQATMGGHAPRLSVSGKLELPYTGIYSNAMYVLQLYSNRMQHS